jgi:hypothetical protein
MVSLLDLDEELLAEGQAHDYSPRTEGPGHSHTYLLVTSRRIVGSSFSDMWSLPFDQVLRAEEAAWKHRWAMRLRHRQIQRKERPSRPLPWDIPRHFRRRRWAPLVGRETILEFSRRDTEAAKAIRSRLTGVAWHQVGADLRSYFGSWWGET